MKIKKSVLLEALKVLGKVVAQTSPVEVVRSVRFVGDGGRLRLMATDGVERVALRVECEVAEAVDFAVEYRALRELIRSTRGGEVEVTGKPLEWPELEVVPEEAVTVELPAQTTITELKARVSSLDPQVAETVAKARVAINQEFVNGPAITLTGHEEVALIPPVSGG